MQWNVVIVGATGAVGQEILSILDQRSFPVGELRLLSSPRSAGQRVAFRGRDHTLGLATPEAFAGAHVVIFSAGSATSKQLAPAAAKAGALVIDNSSAFRMDPGVPLAIPEVNPDSIPRYAPGRGSIVAVPNCSTIIMLMALAPLHRALGVRRAVVSTYQAVSGAGAKAMEELRAQATDVLAGRPAQPSVFHEPCAFNVFSHDSAMDPATGSNVEETKMVSETRKILGPDAPRIAPTCVRVPVMRAHCVSATVTLGRLATLAKVRDTLSKAPGVRLVDDRATNRFPTSLKATGGDDVLVGRLRVDPSQSERAPAEITAESPESGFSMFIAGDQLRKGAALDAVQIAETALGIA
ncbi:MAG: aspartate-semialdehyde dehydrogenase [Planctomyces sp.]|nr:aspartate-semialdehyde dehydrogenase [Planctomyces sp.]MBA4039991.1 aspartate-semialdehyde dehydrogenase [Planctomyces sp.]MBA4120825.1 aspartate-semialdehyde dehydrogenase [Isosphaera sp.]